MFQPISYKINSRFGTREELKRLIDTCRKLGLRVYVDVVLNHFSGSGNDNYLHRNMDNQCLKWENKTSSAPFDRQSPFYTHAFTYKYNSQTGQPPSNEFPGAAIGPEDFHCTRALNTWSDLFILNNGWLVGLTDINTSKENVRERQAAYLVELMSMGVTGFRIDAGKHLSPEDLSEILKKLQHKMGGHLPDDFIVWLEILSGGETNLLWNNPGWYGQNFDKILLKFLNSKQDLEKIKFYDGAYPVYANNFLSRKRVVIENDDHDQQSSTFHNIEPYGCVLVKGCSVENHRNYEIRLFENPYWVENNNEDWPIRLVLSSYYLTLEF
jgi:alpha-amylase